MAGAGLTPVSQTESVHFGLRATDVVLDVLTLAAGIAMKPKETAFSGIRLIRAATAGRFSEQLRQEWTEYVAAGKIKADYADTGQARTIFADTLESLEDANFDDEQLDLLRKLFLAAASETTTDRHNALVRECIKIGLTLDTGEIRVLSAYFRYNPEWREISVGSRVGSSYGENEAMEVLRKHSGLKYAALIQRHEKALIDKGLVRPLGPGSGYAQIDQKLHRLTDFGFAFCEFLKGYDKLKEKP
jgi:hypothetical protein